MSEAWEDKGELADLVTEGKLLDPTRSRWILVYRSSGWRRVASAIWCKGLILGTSDH